MKPLLLLVTSLSLASCSIEQTAASDVDTRQSQLTNTQVTAVRVSEGVRVTNGGNVEIRYLVKNARWLGLLAGCHNEPTSCAMLGAGQSVVVKSADVYGHSADTNMLEVWYWVKGASDSAGTSVHVE